MHRPTIFDPSELRTDVTGKVVRYLQDNGASVEAGEPYVEVEAMKMIMPIKATESGKITQNLSSGTVINAGDLLATLELKDPSKVKKIVEFEDDFDIPMEKYTFDQDEAVQNILTGFEGDVDATVAAALQGASDVEAASEIVVNAINAFV
jgi:acetyl-CoA carboxylase/biotin carboxylase 1